MDISERFGGRDRLARTLLAAGLTAVAVASLRKGRRLLGAMAGAGAVAVGYDMRNEVDELAETIEIGSDEENGELRCAACGRPIVAGQRRGPNESDEIVHEDCK